MFFTNKGKKPRHIGGKLILPGMTREIDAQDHPDYRPPQPEPAPVIDPVQALADGSAKKAIAGLTTLDNEQLAELDILEQEKNASDQRKSLIGAIAKEQLERAQADSSLEQFVDTLPDKSDTELLELRQLHDDEPQILGLIDAEAARRLG